VSECFEVALQSIESISVNLIEQLKKINLNQFELLDCLVEYTHFFIKNCGAAHPIDNLRDRGR
jgi:hypothetical protein